MITRVRLQHWRNYQDATVELEPGTTFVVAANGVGKTSLVEAARFALFGKVLAGANPVRLGAEAAEVSVDLKLPDGRLLSVQRVLRTGARATPATVIVDGHMQTDTALPAVLEGAYGCSVGFLERLAMPSVRGELQDPTSMGLREHLGSLYGMDTIDTTLDQLSTMAKANARQIQDAKARVRDAEANVRALEEAVAFTATRAAQHAEMVERARASAAAARAWEAHQLEVRRWQQAQAQTLQEREELAAMVSVAIGRPVDVVGLLNALGTEIAAVGEAVENVRREEQRARARAEVLQDNLSLLDNAERDCPVCLRPLDQDTVATAHTRSEHDVALLLESAAEHSIRAATLGSRQSELADLRLRVMALPATTLAPTSPLSNGLINEPQSAQDAEATEHAATEAAVDARRESQQAQAALDQARKDQQLRQLLEDLFAKEATFHIATHTLKRAREDLLTRTLGPLEEELGERWSALFPRRGVLAARADGSLARSMSGVELPFGSFSTAESTAALLMLRMLVATMTTRVDFIWFDEPLEHLDPGVRRRVANTLARVTGAGLRQVLVTTYEEPLASRLAIRDSDTVHLVYVRPDEAGSERI